MDIVKIGKNAKNLRQSPSYTLPKGKADTVFVLSGGGALGAAQAGMILGLLSAGVVPDCYVGTSAGSLNSAFMANDNSMEGAHELVRMWSRLKTSDILVTNKSKMAQSLVTNAGMYSNKPAIKNMTSMLGYTRLEDAPTKLKVVTSKVDGNVATCWEDGDLYSVLQASAAIPGVFDPVVLNDSLHVDGGITAMVPLAHALMMDPKHVVVLDISGMLTANSSWDDPVFNRLYSNVLKGQSKHLKTMLKDPRVGVVSLQMPASRIVGNMLDFNNGDGLAELGVESVNRSLKRILSTVGTRNKVQRSVGRTVLVPGLKKRRSSFKDEVGRIHTS